MLTNKQFKSTLNNELINAKSMRDTFQTLIESGLDQYLVDGDTYQLTLLINSSVRVKSLPTVTMKDYIKEHTDLKYAKNKAGEYQFIRADKAKEKVCTMPTETWYDWKKAKHNDVKETDHRGLAIKHVKKLMETPHSFKYKAELLIDMGFSTNDLMNMIDSLQLKEVA